MCPPPCPMLTSFIILEMFCLCINVFLIVKKYTGPHYIVLQQLLKTSFQGVLLLCDSRQTQPAACGWELGLLSGIWHSLTLGWVLRTCSLEKEIQSGWSERRGGADAEQSPGSGLGGRQVEQSWGWGSLRHRARRWGSSGLHSAAQAVSWATAHHFQESGLCRERPPIRCEGAIKYPSKYL